MTARKRDSEFRAVLLEWSLGQIRGPCSGKGHFRSEDGSEKAKLRRKWLPCWLRRGKKCLNFLGVVAAGAALGEHYPKAFPLSPRNSDAHYHLRPQTRAPLHHR